VIVIEMTDNHDMIVPLMAASLLAAGCSRIVCRRPLYKALADQFLGKSGRKKEQVPTEAEETPKQSAD
jgi:H+/Cl- antiporter ClcA